ncbi:MAG: bifunctional DNA-formamidopyrimidine glycosylase/DNA-(apurinic or apyrimidinic site) lyase [Planctomycetota bacterium]|jgi:formamidopyrimidine-DNA glycosylase|nr:bifunctional DNA-formamidopyrimidine glycosylase/DNA-(apurinic or apyrimidinic site) lyase [Planctomycetota bacterium]
MPELPEVETVVRALNRALKGKTTTGALSLGRLRFPFDAAAAGRRLAGKEILRIRRRAKYILIDFPENLALLAHLGMTGRFRVDPSGTPRDRHDRVIFNLLDGLELRFSDARRFGFLKLADLPRPGGIPPECDRLGPEPLERGFTGGLLLALAKKRTLPVKSFLMDQKTVAGVGNIYASEALHAAGIDPRRPTSDLTPVEWERVVRAIKTVLRRAIRQGGSTIRNYRTIDGSEGGFQQSLQVYGKAGGTCPGCDGKIQSIRIGGRSTFFCPECQG